MRSPTPTPIRARACRTPGTCTGWSARARSGDGSRLRRAPPGLCVRAEDRRQRPLFVERVAEALDVVPVGLCHQRFRLRRVVVPEVVVCGAVLVRQGARDPDPFAHPPEIFHQRLVVTDEVDEELARLVPTELA